MADALKIGIAGLGTVGASLVRILHERRDMLATTCGRPIEVVAVTARDKTRDRGIDLSDDQLVCRCSVAWRQVPISTSSSN